MGQGEDGGEIKDLPRKLITATLLKHKEKEVRLYAALCLSDVLRIFAPEDPYQDDLVLKGVYVAFLDALAHLKDPSKSTFECAHALLQNIAAIGLCVPMLDLECEGADALVPQLFETLFDALNPSNAGLVEEDVTKVLAIMIEEDESTSPEVLHAVLERLIQPMRGENSAAHSLACNLVRKSENNLQLAVQHFLTDALNARGAGDHPLSKRYADVLEAVAVVDSTSLVTVWPVIMDELQNDDEEARLRAVRLFGRILSAPGSAVARDFGNYLQQFLKRFNDKCTAVRVEMCRWGASFLLCGNNSDPSVAREVVESFDQRLLDFNQEVRCASVSAICDLAESFPRLIEPELLKAVGDRMVDKKNSVRRLVMKRLSAAYRVYVARFADTETPPAEALRFDWIPSLLLKGCYQPDIKYHVVEPILADLFPAKVSMERRSTYWLQALCSMDEASSRAFTHMLGAKLKVQRDMREYLSVRQKSKASQQSQGAEEAAEEVDAETLARQFTKVGSNFPDPKKAAGHMEKIHAMKDGNIFRGLSALIKPDTSAAECERITDDILKRIGSKNPAYEWAKLLLVKLSQQPFGREHVCRVLEMAVAAVVDKGKLSSVTAALQHLVQLATSAPHVFGVVAKDLTSLVHHGNENVVEMACRITASAPSCLDGTSTLQGGIIDRLKVLCVEGTGAQAKQAARTLVWLACHGKEGRGHIKEVLEVISEAARDDELLDSNLPGVLATVSVVGQRMPALFMQHVDDIETFIVKDLMARPLPQSPKSSRVSSLAQMQSSGLKALAIGCTRSQDKSQAATRSAYTKRVVEMLRSILLVDANDMERFGSAADAAHLRVAAGKAFLVLVRSTPSFVQPDLFVSTSLLVIDSPAEMIGKFEHGIIKHGLPQAFAAPLALCAVGHDSITRKTAADALSSIFANLRRRSVEFRERYASSMDAAALNRTALTHSAEYTLPYLVFLLAHHPDLPSKETGAANNGVAYRPFQQMVSFLVGTLTAGSKQCLPAALKMMRALKGTVDSTNVDLSHGIYVMSDITLLVLNKLATQKGWDTGQFPGQISLPKAFFTLQERRAKGDPIDEGMAPRVGDYSHLPVGFELKAAAAPKQADGQRSKTAPRRSRKKDPKTPLRKNVAAPSRRLPSRAARRTAFVDTDGEEDYDEDEDAMMEVDGDDDGANLATFGLRREPTLELPAPSGWKGEEEEEEELEEEEEEELEEFEEESDDEPSEDENEALANEGNEALDSPVMGKRKSGAPLAVRTNTPPPRSRSARTAAKVTSPLADKRRTTAASSYDPENLDGATIGRVSKQRRR